ncbi:MAG TPA: hypothetical protein ENK12_10110 [Gammaproteobacteria bacterium]|nr:hypothetical protein [Gammaproteobacteria bacterium]
MPDPQPQSPFTALVLAGDRGRPDPLVQQAGACCKALIEIDGTPMVLRVLKALDEARSVGRRLLSGPRREQLQTEPALLALIDACAIDWCEPQPTPSTSAWQAMQAIDPGTPVLVTTADHPLLNADIVDRFCTDSLAQPVDVTVGLAPYPLVQQAFPRMKKTVLHFSDGDYCGCNLFAFLTPEGRRVADYWRQVENERKNPLRLVRLIGWGAVVRYLLGRLSLQQAMQGLSKRMGLRLGAVTLPYAEAAVDVDSVADRVLVQEKLSERG